jgi:hypothetical protein
VLKLRDILFKLLLLLIALERLLFILLLYSYDNLLILFVVVVLLLTLIPKFWLRLFKLFVVILIYGFVLSSERDNEN